MLPGFLRVTARFRCAGSLLTAFNIQKGDLNMWFRPGLKGLGFGKWSLIIFLNDEKTL